MNPYIPEFYRIVKKKKHTKDTFMIRIKADLPHEPGQFFQVSVLNQGEVPISVCSYNKKYIDLNIRDVGTVTHALAQLKVGDTVGVRGPYGHGYPMDFIKGNEVVIIAGGTGFSPVRGVIEYVEQHPTEFRGITMFLGFRCPKEILFKEDIKKWSKKYNVNLTVDRCFPEDNWQGPVALVTKILEESKIGNNQKIAVVCGPPVMMKFVVVALQKLGWNDDQIYVSHERMMSCGIQKCGNCLVGGKYICKDGPVFRYDLARTLVD
ncbi:anaerobic sulfite reductase subunit AsrB [Candidatus Woesearchaeota archaeon]|nr:anaerobic sulfite reductase subunit AsrB [Candidatus Woesearchaeota archaeon]